MQPQAELEATTYQVTLSPATTERLRQLCANGSNAAAWVAKAIEIAVSVKDKALFERKTIEELAARYQSDAPVRSDRDLEALFEKVSHLTHRDFVIHLDETESAPIEALARTSKMPLADTLRKYFLYALAMGWFDQAIYENVTVFTDEEYRKLHSYTGVKGRIKGSEIIRVIEDLLLEDTPMPAIACSPAQPEG